MRAKQVSINATTVDLGDSITISADAGEDVASYSLTVNGTPAQLGLYTFTESVYEPLILTQQLTVPIKLTSVFADGTFETTSVNCVVKITDKYGPALAVKTVLPAYNGYYVSGTGTLECVVETLSTNKSHTITVEGAPSYTVSGDVITLTIPQQDNFQYYEMKVKVVDFRGLSDEVNLERMTIYPYKPAKLSITEMYRCDKDGNKTANGKYARVKIGVDDQVSTLREMYVKINNEYYNANSLDVVVGNDKLELNEDYPLQLRYKSNAMYGKYDYLTLDTEVKAQPVPLSLLDDGYMMGASLGEMIQPYDDIIGEKVINFARDSVMRARSDTRNGVVSCNSDEVVDARRHIKEDILDNLQFRAMSMEEYKRLKNKDFNTVYFVY